jgi:hypothetical protein
MDADDFTFIRVHLRFIRGSIPSFLQQERVMLQVIPEIVEIQGRHKVKLTLRDGQTILDAELVDPLNVNARRKAASRFAERCGEPHAAERIEQAILQCIDEINSINPNQSASGGAGGAGGAGGNGAGEVTIAVTATNLVRAELLLHEQVIGMTVPETVIRNNTATGRWRTYLRWKDGTRESRELPTRIDLKSDEGQGGQGGSLWIHPQPSAPQVPTISNWSDASRQAWIDGEADPDPVAVFDALCAAFDDYLDLPDEPTATNSASEQLPIENCPPLSPQSGTLPIENSVVSPSPTTLTLALWTLLTYVYVAWDAVPYLYVGGPAGSGKTRVFELLSRLCFRPLVSSNLSAPALFRTLHDRGGTLLLDEAERLNEGAPDVAELRSILLAGYKRGGKASRLESSGDSFSMNEFAVFGPKALACINAPTGPLATRCIPIAMFRSSPDSLKPRRRLDENAARWRILRDQLHRLTLGPLGFAAPILSHMTDVCPLAGRQYELWQPLLALCTWLDAAAERNWTPVLLAHAKRMFEETKEQLVPEIDLTTLRVLTDKLLKNEEPTCNLVLTSCRRVDDANFRQVTPQKIASILRRYGLTVRRLHDGRRFRADSLPQIERVEKSYGVDLRTLEKQHVGIVTGGRRY